MLQMLFEELRKIDLKYHIFDRCEPHVITLHATSLDPNGVDEVMRIKAIADRFHAHTVWDGENIEIVRDEVERE